MNKTKLIKLKLNNSSQIDLLVEDERWHHGVDKISNLTLNIIENLLNYLSYFKKVNNCSFCIKLTNNKELQTLNKNFRDKDKPTNVLSFRSYEMKNGNIKLLKNEKFEIYLGDIAVSYDCIFNEHLAQNKPFKNHYTHIIVHGILHLLGYDHEDDQEAQVMENLEINILKLLGISNPYEKI